MAYILGDRDQMAFLAPAIQDYVGSNDNVRAYDAMIDQLDLVALGIDLNAYNVGAPEYHPRDMLKLLIYGTAYGIRSSRKLERATYHNVSFMWLMGGLKPDHKTIARFRSDNRAAIKNVLKQCARLCIRLGLIDGNTLFVDGSKIKANASFEHHWSKKKCQKVLARIDERIEDILKECDKTDKLEEGKGSMVKMSKDLEESEVLREKVKKILEELEGSSKGSVNTTDSDSQAMKSRQGPIIGYNAQSVVDDKHGLIVSADVVQDKNDRQQFDKQIQQAQETLEKPCKEACADTGYANTEALKPIHQQGVKVIVPSQEQIRQNSADPFEKRQFAYDPQRDCYTCPQGHDLLLRKTDSQKKVHYYQISKPGLCQQCPHFGLCTTAKNGRSIARLFDEDLKKYLEAQYEQPDSQTVYKRRKAKVELPFGHWKHNLGVRSFLMRGLSGVRAEVSLLATAFNMTRMITLFGVTGLIGRLSSA